MSYSTEGSTFPEAKRSKKEMISLSINYYLISLTEEPGNSTATKHFTMPRKDFERGSKRCLNQQHSVTNAAQERISFHKCSKFYLDGLTIASLMDDILQCYLDSSDTTVREQAKTTMTKKLEKLNQKLHSFLQSQD